MKKLLFILFVLWGGGAAGYWYWTDGREPRRVPDVTDPEGRPPGHDQRDRDLNLLGLEGEHVVAVVLKLAMHALPHWCMGVATVQIDDLALCRGQAHALSLAPAAMVQLMLQLQETHTHATDEFQQRIAEWASGLLVDSRPGVGRLGGRRPCSRRRKYAPHIGDRWDRRDLPARSRLQSAKRARPRCAYGAGAQGRAAPRPTTSAPPCTNASGYIEAS